MRRPKQIATILRVTSVFIFGVSVGIGSAIQFYEQQNEEEKTRSKTEIVIPLNKQPAKDEEDETSFTPAPTSIITSHGAFKSAYDKRLRNPAWSCIRLPSSRKNNQSSALEEDAQKAERSLSKFKPDPNIPAPFRTRPEDYKASGFDRGHLVAAADVLGSSQEDMDKTFYMSNISPQVGAGMNRGFWQMLERFVRRLTYKYDDVFVCSGPLFLPELDEATSTWRVKYQVIGPKHDIAVPTHFFKCVHAKSNERSSQSCFVIPNRPIDHQSESLSEFEVPVREVERLAGFELFPQLAGDVRKSVCDEVKCELIKESILSGSSSSKRNLALQKDQKQ
jgi:endonuclease G